MLNRREFFLRGATLTGAAALSSLSSPLAGAPVKKLATDRVLLGPMKVPVSRLAMGTGTNGWGGSSNQTRKLGIRGLADLLRAGYDQGITFFDTADQYGSHPHVGEALKRLPREKVTVLTKTHASNEREARADLDRFRRELGTDYIDILLLHCMTDDNWPQRLKGVMDVISEAREKGIVKTHGVSCHTLGSLRAAAVSPWVQVDLARINPARMHMDADVPTVVSVLKQMKDSGKGIIGMKILGAGGLRNRMDEALSSALSRDYVDCFTIGTESREEFAGLTRGLARAAGA